MATDFDALSERYRPTRGQVRREELLARGVTVSAIRSARSSGRWENPHRGVYRVAPADDADAAWAAHVHLGPESVAVLGSAALVHGIEGLHDTAVPEFAMPPGLEKAQRPGVHIHVWRVALEERTRMDGLPVTSVPRTLADILRLKPRLQAVACLDSALHQGLITVDDLPTLAHMMARRRNCVAGRRHLAEGRVGAQSPLETRVRLRATDGGCPPDALQVPVRTHDGVVLGYGDMGYDLGDGRWLVVEADGRAVHESATAVLHDRRRQNAFVGASVTVVRFTWEDTASPGHIPAVLRPILASHGWRPGRA